MNQWENDFLNLENELLSARKKLNDLIYEHQNNGQDLQNDAVYQDKLYYLEVELQYLNNQLQLLKHSPKGNIEVNVPVHNTAAQAAPTVQIQSVPTPNAVSASVVNTTAAQSTPVTNAVVAQSAPAANAAAAQSVPVNKVRKPQDYEKMFGKNLMGIFASVLIFISLIIFATLILPHLTDTLKMLAMYIASIAVLSAGLLLHRKNKDNLFYIAVIGCGAGSLYLSLLLSNLYFKVIGDLVLYGLILLWAVFVRYLTKIKSLVFTVIGQAGIFIASVLGTILCVNDKDFQKFFVLSIFYFISAVVFSNIGRTYLLALAAKGNGGTDDAAQPCYEDNLCTHICKTLNIYVYTIGFMSLMRFAEHYTYDHKSYPAGFALLTFNIVLFMGYLMLEFFFSYREECKHGLAFQILSMINTVLLVLLFHALVFFDDDLSFAFAYLAAVAMLFYVELKTAEYKTFSKICCLILLFIGCTQNDFMGKHLYAYLSIIPAMLIGHFKKDKLYLYAGAVYLALFPFIIGSIFTGRPHELIMLAAIYAAFLYVARVTENDKFKIIGYIALFFSTVFFIYDTVDILMYNYNNRHPGTFKYVGTYTSLLNFMVPAVIHLILNKMEYFGKSKSVERMMLIITALLMYTGCVDMHDTDEILWKLPVILITILLFFANSKKLLTRHKYAGYYIALKYTVLMLCILNSYDVVDYMTSICLLVFAIISIVAGFYKDMITFRLYGLVLSMISIVKLIMIDIKYDSTIENAVSFFVSGVLCFVISFIYNRIDVKVRGK